MIDSWFTTYFAKPVDGPEHESLREGLWIGGADHVCRYYLSMLIERDYFVLPLADLWRDLTEYVVRHASPKAIAFAPHKQEMTHFAVPFLREQFNQAFGIEGRFTKEERGMILLLKHPDWSDEQIRRAVKTTPKQIMNRWTDYRYARILQDWYERGNTG